ncbi:MAG: acetyl-CoA acetyltransferase, partial [Myxococcota bacterium]
MFDYESRLQCDRAEEKIMRDVAILGQGLHPWGKFNDRTVTEMCRTAVEAALADAGVRWR